MADIQKNPPGPPLTPAQPLGAGQPLGPGQPVLQVPAGAVQPQPAVQYVPVAVAQPVAPAPAAADPQGHHKSDAPPHPDDRPKALYLYSHSNMFYWWPVWAVGYIMALVTYFGGEAKTLGDFTVYIHSSKNLGVIFTFVFFLVILITNISVRGLASVIVILAIVIGVLLMAYFDVWRDALRALDSLAIYMNLGFYVFFSTAVLVVWLLAVFVYDRLEYWVITHGRVTHHTLVGDAARSYDTRGMLFQKRREDLFRHWILGLGSGDLEMITAGASSAKVSVPNVLFVETKVEQIKRLIATQSTEESGVPG